MPSAFEAKHSLSKSGKRIGYSNDSHIALNLAQLTQCQFCFVLLPIFAGNYSLVVTGNQTQTLMPYLQRDTGTCMVPPEHGQCQPCYDETAVTPGPRTRVNG
mmetsp:Transcript_19154/g.37858  ORF Transcript_19154/g.37858 Transcript_19154/m.37858 type:complete len:102 (+) Transcript_19154:3616-3921(+)